jgi:hypothetical protein
MQEEKHMIKGETLKVLSAVAYSSQVLLDNLLI